MSDRLLGEVKVGRVLFEAFNWDSGNSRHCQAHGISIEEVEHFFVQALLYFEDSRSPRDETRWIAVGETENKRLMLVAFTFRKIGDERLLRPISARYIHRNSKEEKIYEEVRKRLLQGD